jgi:multicomponent Na+:H+ antiporter subunit E
LLLRPQPGRTDLRRLPGGVWSAIRYVVILIVDVLKSGIGVARIVLDPALPIRPGIIAIESGCETELGTAISAHAISITPGELVLGIDEAGVLYVHCLDATRSAESATAAQKQRRELLSRIFR